MPGYRTPEIWQYLYVPAKVKANWQRMVNTFPICNISLVIQFQVRLPCGDFKLAGSCLNDCTALAAGRHRQVCQPSPENLVGFWQPILHSMLTQTPSQNSSYSIIYSRAPALEAQTGFNCIYCAHRSTSERISI